MNLIYDLRGIGIPVYDTGFLPPAGVRVGCNPLGAIGMSPLADRVSAGADVLVAGVKGTVVHGKVGLPPQVLTTNFNSKIQYMFRSRIERGSKVTRSVRCEACDITLNSEQQAKQHYKGKFHQRKLRQQTQKQNGGGAEDDKKNSGGTEDGAQNSGGVEAATQNSGGREDATQNSKNVGGVKRFLDEDSEKSRHSAKLRRLEPDNNSHVTDDVNPDDDTVALETNAIDIDVTSHRNEASDVISQTTKYNDDVLDSTTEADSTQDVARINESNLRREFEISIEMKNTCRNVSRPFAVRPASMHTPAAHQMTQLAYAGVPKGVLVAPQPTATCPSMAIYSPSVVPWQGFWLPQKVQTQLSNSQGFHLSTPASPGTHNSAVAPLISGLPTQRIVGGLVKPAEVNMSAFPLAVYRPLNRTQQGVLLNPVQCRSDKISNQSVVSRTWESLEPQNNGFVQSTGCEALRSSLPLSVATTTRPLEDGSAVVSGNQLDHLDPVSRAVYSNFLGYLSTSQSKFKIGRRR